MFIKKENGSFMIEFLVSLAIVSIALVGLIKLQNRALKDTGDINTDSTIALLIDEISERYNLRELNFLNLFDRNELTSMGKAFNIKITLPIEGDRPSFTLKKEDGSSDETVVRYTVRDTYPAVSE